MPSCFPAFFNSSKSKNKTKKIENNLNNDPVPSSSASTLSNDSLNPNNVVNNVSNNSVNTLGTPNTTTHTTSKEVIHEYVPLQSEPQMSLYSDRDALDRVNAELKLSESELKSAQLKLKIASEKNEQLLRQQEKQKRELEKTQLELEESQKRIEQLTRKDKELEDINKQISDKLQTTKNLDPEVEALLTGLAYSLKEAYSEIDDYKNRENDYLIMANETGEEIRRLQMKQRDTNLLANECGQELCDAKCELEQAFNYIKELKQQLSNSEQIIVGLVEELKAANSDYEKLQDECGDLNTFANETGEEIVHLRSVNKDQNTLINEVGQEFYEAKNEIEKLKKENEALCLLLNGLGQECVNSRDRCVNLENTENDLLLLANESGEEIQSLRAKIRDQNVFMNECGDELVTAKRELAEAKTMNDQYCLVIEGLANMLNERNDTVTKYESETRDLLGFANESGEEIVALRSKINDSNNLINELGNELLDTKSKAAHYKKCANLFIDLIDVLSNEYAAAEKDKQYLENEKDDLLAMATETGDEIIAVRNKLRDEQVLINECTTELVETKAENQQLKQQLEQARQILLRLEAQPPQVVC